MSIFDGSAELGGFKCEDAKGRNIVCEDGKTRLVHEIVPSHKYPYMSVVNENDPDSQSGYFVHNLSLACQLMGKPLPDEDTKQAFNRTMEAQDYNEPKNRHERRIMELKLRKQDQRRRGFFTLN